MQFKTLSSHMPTYCWIKKKFSTSVCHLIGAFKWKEPNSRNGPFSSFFPFWCDVSLVFYLRLELALVFFTLCILFSGFFHILKVTAIHPEMPQVNVSSSVASALINSVMLQNKTKKMPENNKKIRCHVACARVLRPACEFLFVDKVWFFLIDRKQFFRDAGWYRM